MAQIKSPSQPIDLRKTWESVRKLSDLERSADTDHEDREASEIRSQRLAAQSTLSKAATDFLKANGFNGGGRRTKKIPGL